VNVNWSRRHTLITGLALIVIVNAVALAGVAYNRSGEADSVLPLTERELQLPTVWNDNKENSGLSLEMQWRVMPPAINDLEKYSWRTDGYGRTPAWLNRIKMVELGFEPRPSNRLVAEQGEFAHQLPRAVLLVLEFNGDAYRAALARAEEYSQKAKDTEDGQKALEDEKTLHSRLFVVDAGLDHLVLRAKYPDRRRFAIMRGQVRPSLQAQLNGQATDPTGFIDDVSAAALNVPLDKRSVFDALRGTGESNITVKGRYKVDVAFGQRLEPWIVKVEDRLAIK